MNERLEYSHLTQPTVESSMYRYYTETRGDIFMPRGEAEGQKYINPSFCVIPDIHTTGKVCSYFTVHSSEYSN